MKKSAFQLSLISLAFLLVGNAAANAGVIDKRIDSSYDDAEERPDGKISRADADLDLVHDHKKGDQTIGIRFHDLAIPQGATIVKAWVQFTADETSSESTTLAINAAAADTTGPFRTTRFSISSLPRTATSVTWNPPAWTVIGASGESQRTPDLAAVLQEVVLRPGWTSGNAMTLIVSGTGKRVAESWNGDSSAAPLLHVEFSGGNNQVPVVDAGADLAVNLPNASIDIDATVNDDGLPGNSMTVTWNHVGGTGAGSVSFSDPNAVDTTATFSADPGSYILRLTANDGELSSSDDVVVQVLAEGVTSAVSSITQINYFDTGYDSLGGALPIPSTDPAGVLYDESTGQLLIADSEINEIPEVWGTAPYNLFVSNPQGVVLDSEFDLTIEQNGEPRNEEPTGIAYCANDAHYYISNDDRRLIYRYARDAVNGFVLTDVVSTSGATSDPEGITCDGASGNVFVIGGKDINIVVYRYENGFVLDRIIDLTQTAGTPAGIPSDPEGIAFDSASGHLFVMSNDDDAIFEYTDTGVFLNKFDVRSFSPRPMQPQGLSIGPSSQTPGKQSFYISDAMFDNNYDPDERDGRIFEAEINR